MEKKFSKIFLMTFPLLHSGDFAGRKWQNMLDQYKYIIDRIAKQGDVLLILNHGSTDKTKGLETYAEKKLRNQFIRRKATEYGPYLTPELGELLDRSREIKISGCGELMQHCAKNEIVELQSELAKNGFIAKYFSHSFIGSMTSKRGRTALSENHPYFSDEQFKAFKERNKRHRLM